MNYLTVLCDYNFYGLKNGFQYRKCIPSEYIITDFDNIVEHLNNFGYVVLTIDDFNNIIFYNSLLTFFKDVCNVFDIRRLRDTSVFKYTDILKHCFLFNIVRSNEKVINLFKHVIQCEKLLCLLNNMVFVKDEDKIKRFDPSYCDNYLAFYVIKHNVVNFNAGSGILVWPVSDLENDKQLKCVIPLLLSCRSGSVVLLNRRTPYQFINTKTVEDPSLYLPLRFVNLKNFTLREIKKHEKEINSVLFKQSKHLKLNTQNTSLLVAIKETACKDGLRFVF